MKRSLLNNMPKKKLPPHSQLTTTKSSDVVYNWAVIFSWDLDAEKPFEIYQRNAFTPNEIPDQWYTKCLSPTCRHQKLQLAGLRGDKFSLFCKIEKGN